jgi:ClpX C4-type zinc finger
MPEAGDETDDADEGRPAIGIARSAPLTGPAYGMPFPAQFGAGDARRCILCGRGEARVQQMLVARGVLICDRCIKEAASSLDESSGSASKIVRFKPHAAEPPDAQASAGAIEQVVGVVFGATRGNLDERIGVIEDGAELRLLLEELESRTTSMFPQPVDVTIERLRFTDPDEAELTLGIWLPGNFTMPMMQPAHAIRLDGSWKMSRDTMTRLAGLAGVRATPA